MLFFAGCTNTSSNDCGSDSKCFENYVRNCTNSEFSLYKLYQPEINNRTFSAFVLFKEKNQCVLSVVSKVNSEPHAWTCVLQNYSSFNFNANLTAIQDQKHFFTPEDFNISIDTCLQVD